MNDTFVARVLGAALAVACVAPVAAPAATRPLPQRILSRGGVARTTASPVPRTTHVISGAVVSLRGDAFALRLRGGRLQSVDATDAFAAGRVSAPLFIGKLVEIAGAYDARRVLHAQSVTRVPRVDATTPQDR